MQLDKGNISSSQFTFLVIAFIFGTATVVLPGAGAKNSAWLVMLLGMMEGLMFMLVYTSLAGKYPGKNLVEINDIVYGPLLGKIVSILYILFFIHIAPLALMSFSEFFSLVMPNTPILVFSILILGICAAAVRNGVEVLARTTLITVPVIVITVILDTLMIIPKMDLSNFLPVFNLPLKDFIIATHNIASFPFGETIVFLMIIPYLNQPAEARKAITWAFLFSGFIFSLAVARNIAVLGNTIESDIFANFHLVRLIDIGNILTRLDIIIMVNILFVGFLKVAVFYYGSVLGIAQILKMRSYMPLVIPIGILIINIGLMSYDSYTDVIKYLFEYFPYYSLPFTFILPLLTLILSQIPNVMHKYRKKI